MVFATPASLFVSISPKQRSAITSPGTYIVVIVIPALLADAVILWRQLKVSRLDKGSAVQAPTVSATLSRFGSLGKSARAPPPRPALAGLAKTPPPNGRRRHDQ
jgi:hypothetical protein